MAQRSLAILAGPSGDRVCVGGLTSSSYVVHGWDGQSWSQLTSISAFYTNFGRLTGSRSTGQLLLGEGYQGYPSYTFINAWNGTAWTAVWSQGGGKESVGARFGYRADAFPGAPIVPGGWLTYAFSTTACNQYAVRSQVDAVVAGVVGGVPRLYFGGSCLSGPQDHLREYVGSVGTQIGDQLAGVAALEVFDDGSGSALYAGGPWGVMRWDGAVWSGVGGGVNGAVASMAVFDDGYGPALYVSGGFTQAGGQPAPFVARWGRAGCYPNCDGSFCAGPGGCATLQTSDFGCFLERFAAGDPRANCDGSTTPPVLNVADFTCFLQSFAAGCP